FRLHDLECGAITERRWAPEGIIRGAAAHPRLPRLALATASGVDILDWTTGQRLARLQQELPEFIQIAWHPSGEMLAVAYHDQVQLWDVGGGRRLGLFPHRDGGGLRVGFSQTGDLLASIGWRGRLKLWDLRTRHEIFTTAVSSCGGTLFGLGDRLGIVFPDS